MVVDQCDYCQAPATAVFVTASSPVQARSVHRACDEHQRSRNWLHWRALYPEGVLQRLPLGSARETA